MSILGLMVHIIFFIIALNGADEFSVFSSKESIFVVGVMHAPLELSLHATGNIYWMFSSPACAAGTIFVMVHIFFLGRPLFFRFLCLQMRTHAFDTYVTYIYKTHTRTSVYWISRIPYPQFLKFTRS